MDANSVYSRSLVRQRYLAGGAIVAAFVAYGLLAFPLRHWLVDDAAISMAYAANWTTGRGLVAQPGVPPVEGYSNFLWVVLLALLNMAGAMTPMTIKLVSGGLVAAALVSLHSTCRQLIPREPLLRAAVLLLVGTNSAIVTWTTSGLENPLTLLLACELLRIVSRARSEGVERMQAVYAGLLVGAMAMNRPDGIALAAFPPLALVMAGRREWRLLVPYGATITAIMAAFLAFRYSTFGAWVPNTFYAKQASSIDPIASCVNAIVLLRGPVGSTLVMVAVLAMALFQVRRGLERHLIVPLCLMAVAGGVFVLLPPDWMPDRRFATAFIPAAVMFVGVVLGEVPQRRFRAVLVACILVLAVGVSVSRLVRVYRLPIMPAATVEKDSIKFNERARLMGLKDGSILLPDIGAALLTSELRVYDLAGLIDPVVARSLRSDTARFHDYVFEEIRPTFIRALGPWAEYAAFDKDPRFRRDYMPIQESVDAQLLKQGKRLVTGEYVRRDALAATGDASMLQKLRSIQ